MDYKRNKFSCIAKRMLMLKIIVMQIRNVTLLHQNEYVSPFAQRPQYDDLDEEYRMFLEKYNYNHRPVSQDFGTYVISFNYFLDLLRSMHLLQCRKYFIRSI